MSHWMQRMLRAAGLALALGMAMQGPARAQEKITVLTTWFAQAEHGGYYQALATGLYKQAGLDVTIKMGGPQVNGVQLLLAGMADFISNYDFTILQGVERGFPLVTVAAPFQFDMQGIIAREDVADLASLKNKTIYVASTAMTYWWPWFKKRYNYVDEQVRPFTGSMQPLFVDPNVVQQAFPSSVYEAQQKGMTTKFFLLAKEGYPPYTGAITTTRKMVDEKPEVVARFVKATMEGWKSFMKDPAPAIPLIKKDNPAMTDGQIAYTINAMRELEILTSGDAAKMGIGAMTDERWQQTADFMVSWGMLKPDTDWRKAYTTRFVKDLRVMP